MAVKPILFNADMVRALLEGRKTVTRRILKNAEMYINCECNARYLRDAESGVLYCERCGYPLMASGGKFLLPPYVPGDVLWVRETWCVTGTDGTHDQYGYRADGKKFGTLWHPSIHMPREAARIFLRVKDVRVERLRDINTIGAYQEGIANCQINPLCVGTCDSCMQAESPLHQFEHLWDSTIKPDDRTLYGWVANPWVWVIEFEKISREEATEEWMTERRWRPLRSG